MTDTTDLSLIPFPKIIEPGHPSPVLPATGRLAFSIPASALTPERHRQAASLLEQLRDDLERRAGLHWSPAGNTGDADIVLAIDHDGNDDGCYTLDIGADCDPVVLVRAAGMRGLRYGTQTLRQIIRQNGRLLPGLHIEDEPSMDVRACSYDVSRGRVPTLDTLIALADTLCLYKYDQLQLYVEHTIDLPDSREAWAGHDPLTAGDIMALDAHCADLGIELVPAMATFGHMYEILRTRTYRDLGEMPDRTDRPFSFVERMLHHTLNPVDPRSLEFVEKRMDAYSALFRSRRFNICADETFDLGRGASASEAEHIGLPRLYAGFVGALCDHLRNRGIRPMMYADIALKHPELLDQVSRDIELANWDYLANPSEDNVRKVAESGLGQYVCPGVQTWNRLLPDLDAAWSNISHMCAYGHRHGALGMIATDWGDYGHVNDPAMSLPGLLYATECAWNDVPRDRTDVDRAVGCLAFADRSGRVPSLLAEAARLQTFSWADAVQYRELDDDGHANKDVLFVLGQEDRDGSDDPAAVRGIFLSERAASIRLADTHDRRFADLSDAVANAMDNTCITQDEPFAPGQDVPSLLIDGQRLLDRLGVALLHRHGLAGSEEPEPSLEPAGDPALASLLERWMEEYTRRWRAIGREADLRRLHDVVAWYAALLRQDGNSSNADGESSN